MKGRVKAQGCKRQGRGGKSSLLGAAYVSGIEVEPGQDIERELPRGWVIFFWETTED